MNKAITVTMALIFILLFSGCSNSINNVPNDNPELTFSVERESSSESESIPPAASDAPAPPDTPALSPAPPDTPTPPPVPAERRGFEGSNIFAGGLFCDGGDGFIYFRSETDWRLHRAKPDGSEKTKICDRVISNINVLDGWVYFISHSDGEAVYRVRTDGTEETKLIEGYCENLYVAESGMYFDIREETSAAQVYHANLDGTGLAKIVADCYVAYYYDGKIYTDGATAYTLGVYDIATGEHTILVQTYTAYVSVDDSGVYYWAVDKGGFRRMDMDGSNDRIVVGGGDYFNYNNGNLYYVGIGENANGPCHVVNRMDIETGEITTLYEELNEFFDWNGELIGVTIKQMQNGDYDPDIFEDSDYGMVLKGGGNFLNESVGFTYVVGEHIFMRALLRESVIQKGEHGCVAMLDGGVTIWE